MTTGGPIERAATRAEEGTWRGMRPVRTMIIRCGPADMVHCPECNTSLESRTDFEAIVVEDEERDWGFTRQQIIACEDCGVAIGANGIGGFDEQREKREESILSPSEDEEIVTSIWECQICKDSKVTDVENVRELALEHYDQTNHIVEITVFKKDADTEHTVETEWFESFTIP